jgi:hypothetical protein
LSRTPAREAASVPPCALPKLRAIGTALAKEGVALIDLGQEGSSRSLKPPDHGEGHQRKAEQEKEKENGSLFKARAMASLDEFKKPICEKIERDSDSDKVKQTHRCTDSARGVSAVARLRQISRNEMKLLNDQAP